jgi:hypothetical protein
MANNFLALTKQALRVHGRDATYVRTSASVYSVASGSSTNTTTNHQVRMYKKHINATQYHYPDLIGKTSAIFYFANDALTFQPKVNDRIVYQGESFTVKSFSEHIANGEIILYKVVGVRG